MSSVIIHDSIFGSKLRALAKSAGCSQNECVGLLVRLWLWGINNAGKDGCLEYADKDDVANVIAAGIEQDALKENDVLEAMIETGWIDDVGGRLYIHDWGMWQAEWYAKAERREKDAKRKREARAKAREEHADSTCRRGQATEPKKAGNGYSRPFEEFWSKYPRKKGKGEAYAKYMARLADGWSDAQLLLAAENYAKECEQHHTAEIYIKHAKTFLSDRTPFVDYLPAGLNSGMEAANGTGKPDDDDLFGDWREQ